MGRDDKERTVGLGFLVAIIRRVFGYLPKTIWGGVALGAVVGLIITLVKGDLDLILLSCAVGLVAGLVFELIISIFNRRRIR